MKEEELLQTTDVRVRIMTLDPHTATPWHHHSEITDRMVALDVPVTVQTRDPDTTITLQPGDHCAIEPNTIHRVCNFTNQEARYLLIQGIGLYDFIPADEP